MDIYELKCKKCGIQPAIISFMRINKGIRLQCCKCGKDHSRYIRFDLLTRYNFDKALDQAEKELESQENEKEVKE